MPTLAPSTDIILRQYVEHFGKNIEAYGEIYGSAQVFCVDGREFYSMADLFDYLQDTKRGAFTRKGVLQAAQELECA